MPKKIRETKGEAKGPQGKGKANGQAKPNGQAAANLPGSYARFKGDFSANAPIRAKAPKLLAFKTYGKLAEHMRKSFAAGQTKDQIAEGLGVTAARVNELAVCLWIE
jgi:hypothetical protein